MAITTSTSVILGFLDNFGDQFKVTVSKAKDLTNAQGKVLVNAAMDAMITNQPFTSEIAIKQSAKQRQVTETDLELS